MARVYMVNDLQDSPPSTWALKQLRSQQRADAAVLKLFDQEADLLKSLSHRNIPQYRMRFDESGEAYLVLEFITGQTLADVLSSQGRPIEQNKALEWGAQICDVLDYLHSRRPPIIYRDLKPDNLMVTDNGVIKVIDFGIARTFKAGKGRDTVSIGTEAYAPPEQYGSDQTDSRSDIYALGATLYHLLTGYYPPHAKLPGAPTPIRTYNPQVSQLVADIVDRAMQKERRHRFQSAVEMKQAITVLLPVQGSVPSGSFQTSTPPRTHSTQAQSSKLCSACGGVCPAAARFCRYCGHSFMGIQPALLRVIQPHGATWVKPIPQDRPVVIGTTVGGGAPGLDLSFYDRGGYVSRRHAQISISGNNYVLTDLGSTNGTKLNNVALSSNMPAVLHNGDRIQLGPVVLQIQFG